MKKYELSLDEQRQLLADWRALCAYLEAQPYNASYEPRCRAAYLLTGPRPADKTLLVPDPDASTDSRWGRRSKQIPNPGYAEELARARRCRMLIAERRRLGLVFWSTGYGWRLHKDYRERLAAEQARLDQAATAPALASEEPTQ